MLENVIHGNMHDADRRLCASAGEVGARCILRLMRRIKRHQVDRDADVFGYRVLGGEA